MADRTAARIFGDIFELLASSPTDEHKRWAKKLWAKTYGYDFTPDQMGCDDALEVLDLLQYKVDPDYPKDGPVPWYGLRGSRKR